MWGGGGGGGEYICTQGGKIGSFSTLVHLFRLRLRLYLKHWGINLPVCIQRENAEKHSNVISVTERTEEFTELVLDTVCPSVCLSVAESHGERCVCVCVCISPLLRERGLLQPNSGSAGPQSCLSHVPDVAMATEDCKTDTHVCVHADTRAHTHTLPASSLPHTHSRSSPAAERCNWNTEELRRGITQHWQNTEDARRERRTEGGEDSRGGRGERERERQGNETPPSPAVADIHRKKPKHLLAHQDYTVSEWESSQSPGPCYMRYPCLFAIWLCEQYWNGLKSWISDMLLIFCCQTVTKDHNSFPAHIFKCQHPIQNKTPQVSTHHFSVPK